MAKESDASYYEIGHQWVAPAMTEVTSADQFFDIMRESGTYIPRRIARDVWKQYGEAEGWKPLIERLPPDWKIPRRWTVEREYAGEGKYLGRVVISGFDPETGKVIERRPYIGMDKQGTIGDIMTGADIIMANYAKQFQFTITDISFEGYYHVAGEDWD